jgi:hypothetical protein
VKELMNTSSLRRCDVPGTREWTDYLVAAAAVPETVRAAGVATRDYGEPNALELLVFTDGLQASVVGELDLEARRRDSPTAQSRSSARRA